MTTDDYEPSELVWTQGEDIDLDGSDDGDYVLCPVHREEIIYVTGTDQWKGHPASFGWSTISTSGYCPRCQKHYPLSFGSYGG